MISMCPRLCSTRLIKGDSDPPLNRNTKADSGLGSTDKSLHCIQSPAPAQHHHYLPKKCQDTTQKKLLIFMSVYHTAAREMV